MSFSAIGGFMKLAFKKAIKKLRKSQKLLRSINKKRYVFLGEQENK